MAIRVRTNSVVGLDGGAIDGAGGSIELSCAEDRDRMDAHRAEADAVLVGAATVRGEDPSFAIRSPDRRARREAAGKGAHPRPVVLSASGTLPADARVLDEAPLVLVAPEGLETARSIGAPAEVVPLPASGNDRERVEAVLSALGGRGIEDLLVEGGPRVLRLFAAAERIDEVHLTLSPHLGAGVPASLVPPVMASLARFELLEARPDGDFVYLHYRRIR